MANEALNGIIAMLKANRASQDENAEIDIELTRRGMEQMTALVPLPENTKCEEIDAAGIASEWVQGPDADPSKVVLYLHGGGYCIGSINTHRGLAARISNASGARVLVIDYRLAPESPFPAAVEDATAAYGWLLEQGVAPECIAIGGDSAGGGLTFATLVALRDQGSPLPAAGFTLSPWVDLEGIGESMSTRAEADPMIEKNGLVKMGKLYLADADPKTPLAAPLYADLSGLPPMYVQVGDAETLLDDATRIVENGKQAGVAIELEVFDDMIHVFQAFAPAIPEAQSAIDKIGAFVKRNL